MPLSRNERLALIRNAQLPQALTDGQRRNLLNLLEKLEFLAKDSNFLTYEFICGAMRWRSKQTAMKVVALAEALQLLTVKRNAHRAGGQWANAYFTNWDTLRKFSRGRDELPGSTEATPEYEVSTPESRPCTPGSKLSTPYIKELTEPPITEPLNRTSSSLVIRYVRESSDGRVATTARESSDWQVVEESLRAIGLMAAKKLVRKTQASGQSPTEALAAIAHFQSHPGAWTPGAVYWRLSGGHSGQAASDGWPPPDAKYLAQRKRESSAKHEAAKRQAHERERLECEAEKQRVAKLEQRFGATLDALDADDLLALAHRAWGDRQFLHDYLRQRGRSAPSVRISLLEALANEPQPTERTHHAKG